MAICPRGHDSDADDFCDVCGRPIGQEPRVAEPTADYCPVCGTPRAGSVPYCERCGHEFALVCPAGSPDDGAPNSGWSLLVTADAEYFGRVMAMAGPDASAIRFPPYYEPWSVALHGDRMRVGRRRSGKTPDGAPEIDMASPPTDTGISYLHAVLMREPDGTWAIVDPGSANGTTLNGRSDPIECNLLLGLKDGDRIHIGAWTTLEVRVQRPT
ncbi:FHA domain-containing protein [Streptomycetaceae bacterium NBC_01309]